MSSSATPLATTAFTTLGDVPALLSIQVTEGGSGNYGKYDIPEAAPLLAKAYGSESAEERTQAILDLNALMADVVPSIEAGIARARETIASGAARAKLDRFVRVTQRLGA